MPTPNWGPQSGVAMDDATFDAYVAANPPPGSVGDPSRPVTSTTTDTVLGASRAAGGGSYNTGTGQPRQNQPDNYWRDFYRQGYNSPGQTPVGFQTGNQDQARLEQERVIQDLQRAARGDPNSLAQQQLAQGYQGAQQQQASLGSTMRGQSAGAAMRGVQAGQQGIQRGLAGDQQMLQLQEQQAAQQMLAQLLSQQQGQDISQAQSMAGAAQGSQGLNDAMMQFYLGGGVGQDLAATERQNQIGRAQAGFTDANNAITTQLFNAGAGATAGALGTYGTFGTPQKQQAGHTPYGVDHG